MASTTTYKLAVAVVALLVLATATRISDNIERAEDKETWGEWARDKIDALKGKAEDAKDTIKDKAADIKESAMDKAEDLGEGVKDMKDRVVQGAQNTAQNIQDRAHNIKEGMKDSLSDTANRDANLRHHHDHPRSLNQGSMDTTGSLKQGSGDTVRNLNPQGKVEDTGARAREI